MDYRKPYTYVLYRDGGTMTLVLTGLALGSAAVVPVVGQMVAMGYSAEVTEDIERDPAAEDHDRFDLNNFARYLTRGVWPFLAAFLLQLVLAIFAIAGIVAGVGLAIALNAPWVGVLTYLGILLPLSVLGAMVSLPLTLHVQLTGTLKLGQALAFTSRFLGKLWGQCLVTLVVHMLISAVIMTAGLLVCCVGVFPAAALAMFARDHFAVQLYRMYLAEGGEPIGSPAELAEFDPDDR